MNQVMSRYHCLPHHRFPPTPPGSFGKPPTTPTSPVDFTDKIPITELKLSSETLGSGSFGTVFKGRWRGKKVAVKQFRTREEIDSFSVEVQQLSFVKHQNIVSLYGSSTTEHSAYLIMEYAEGGSLNHLLHERKNQEYDLRHACSWAMQTARGVAYLHGLKPKAIMHRDLKPANLLLFSHGKILKICDFGTACAVKTQMTNNTGSASYMAPEVFATSSYMESGDVFSWSIIFWEILARKQPYSDQQNSNPYSILWKVSQGFRPNEIENCPNPIWSLISRSWDKEPEKRPSMLQVAEEMEFIFSMTDRRPAIINRHVENNVVTSPTAITPTNQKHQTTPPHHIEQAGSPVPIFSQLDHYNNPLHHPHHNSQQQQQQQQQSHKSSSNISQHQITSTISSQASAEMKLQNHLFRQDHKFEYLKQQQFLQQQQSIHSQVRQVLRKKALQTYINSLMEEKNQLECSDQSKAASESFKEFEDLKSNIKKIKDVVDKNNSIRTRSSKGSASTGQTLSPPNHHHQQQPHHNHHEDIDMKRAC